MKVWPLKVKFGLYSAGLAYAAVLGFSLVLMPIIYHHQLTELDSQLEDNAEELFRDVENFKGAPQDYRKGFSERFIPVALRRRYLQIMGPEGQVLHRSANLRGMDIAAAEQGLRTIVIFDRNARVGSFRHGLLTLHIGTRLGTIEAMQEDLRIGLLWSLPVAALVVFSGGWLLARRALKPVADLTSAAEKIGVDQPSGRLPVPPGQDEIARLTVVLNASFDRLQKSYEAAARFSADASHQLKTPVTVLRSGLEVLRDTEYLKTPEQEEILELLKQTRRLSTLVDDLLLLAQVDAGRLKLEAGPLELDTLLESLADDTEAACLTQGIAFRQNWSRGLRAVGDARRISVVLQNLTENAVKYCTAGGTVGIAAEPGEGVVRIRISNSSPAIPEKERESIFERFHRAGVGENIRGHGLGLNIARELARAQGGEVRLVSSDGEWTVFELELKSA
ncbi:MAG: integral rane sensor signal transduction histidine kinase [Verrucomicrobiales bacterium]|nr:integral rane sensor signal transduction histidine kinase [Verrucomicrobiales bacterium]